MTRTRFAAQVNLSMLVYLLALVKFIFPYVVQNGVYEPHRDEFLYLAEGRHLAWGYFEVPPMISVFGYLTNLLGGSLFWIKFWPSLFGALTYFLVAKLIRLFGGGWFALVLGFIPFVLGYYVHVHFMLQPNFLEMFFWTLMAYGLINYVHTGKKSGLYIAGIALGLGMLSKYSISFFAFGLLAGLLFTKERKIFLNRHFYYAMVVALFIFMPNLVWEWVHGFPFFEQMKELKAQQLQNVSQWTFLADQLLFNLPCIFIWLSGLYWLGFSAAGKPYRFVGWAGILAIVIITISHGKGYYGMPAYPVLFGFGAVCLERWTAGKLNYWRYAMVVFSITVGFYFDAVTLPFLPQPQLAAYYEDHSLFKRTGFLQWEDMKDHPLPQDFADMLSWREMTVKVARLYNSLDSSEKRKTMIDCDNYGEAGAIDYYGPKHGLPSPMSHGASYLFWTPRDFNKRDIFILVTDNRKEIYEDFIKEFQYAAIADSITNPNAREFGSYILLLKNPSQKFRKVWEDYYESLRRETSIFH